MTLATKNPAMGIRSYYILCHSMVSTFFIFFPSLESMKHFWKTNDVDSTKAGVQPPEGLKTDMLNS